MLPFRRRRTAATTEAAKAKGSASYEEDAYEASSGAYGSIFTATAASAPIFAAFVAIVLYVIPWEHFSQPLYVFLKNFELLHVNDWWPSIVTRDWAVPLSLLFLFAFWPLFPPIWKFFKLHKYFDTENHLTEIIERQRKLAADIESANADSLKGSCQEAAYKEAKEYNSLLEKQMKKSLSWNFASRYLKLLRILHRAEQTTLALLPLEAVLVEARLDQARLQGSTIPKSAGLLAWLGQAIAYLEEHVAKSPPSAAPAKGATPESPPNPSGGKDAAQSPCGPVKTEQQARAVVRAVRYVIDEDRDDTRDNLVRARDQLNGTIMLTALATYFLLGLVTVTGVEPHFLLGATVYYLVGALSGLINLLNLQARAESAGKDYGLSIVHLALTPLLSGLAAVGGVLITATTVSNKSLGAVFDLTKLDVASLIVAAVFGLTPGLLIGRLQQQTEPYQRGLQSSEPSDGKSGPAAP